MSQNVEQTSGFVSQVNGALQITSQPGLAQFLDPSFLLLMLGALTLAVLLSALIAFHPSEARRVTTREELEQPKTMVLYGLVGALVGHISNGNPSLAFVLFGLGGLMRFRTDAGGAKGTARLILCALIGICVGLQAYVVAVLATLFSWVTIWWLERRSVGNLQLLGVEVARMSPTSLAYRELLSKLGCRIVGETRSPNRGEIQMVFVPPTGVGLDQLTGAAEALTPELRATPAWTLS